MSSSPRRVLVCARATVAAVVLLALTPACSKSSPGKEKSGGEPKAKPAAIVVNGEGVALDGETTGDPTKDQPVALETLTTKLKDRLAKFKKDQPGKSAPELEIVIEDAKLSCNAGSNLLNAAWLSGYSKVRVKIGELDQPITLGAKSGSGSDLFPHQVALKWLKSGDVEVKRHTCRAPVEVVGKDKVTKVVGDTKNLGPASQLESLEAECESGASFADLVGTYKTLQAERSGDPLQLHPSGCSKGKQLHPTEVRAREVAFKAALSDPDAPTSPWGKPEATDEAEFTPSDGPEDVVPEMEFWAADKAAPRSELLQAIITAVEPLRPDILRCYGAGLDTNRVLSGRISVFLEVGKSGGVSNFSGGGDMPNSGVVRCVSEVVSRAKLGAQDKVATENLVLRFSSKKGKRPTSTPGDGKDPAPAPAPAPSPGKDPAPAPAPAPPKKVEPKKDEPKKDEPKKDPAPTSSPKKDPAPTSSPKKEPAATASPKKDPQKL